MESASTSVTLLGRLRACDDQEAWQRFVNLYSPVVYLWAIRAGLDGEAAADLVQETLATLLRAIPNFEYDPDKGRFRGWLKTIVLRCARDVKAKRRPEVIDPALLVIEVRDPSGFWEIEYDRVILERAFDIMRSEFEETTWRACWEHVTSGRSAREIGQELGISETAVFTAKSHVLKRLREEFRGLLD